ncbi:unnamed protein product [Clonostachys rosea f. rosea IK726]|uniref:Uncharacterized protein n=2 Tax=Clonostachys rosea f. rosea IK726 TaxID=1349383 RepID=A0ACA9UIK5_BIOOC|nr:unnamed protein product [Clonostachys rosea f. rosea IK726]CAG9952889.1 unnamed protein product [Clonostachys rosea f. rosea IK726]
MNGTILDMNEPPPSAVNIESERQDSMLIDSRIDAIDLRLDHHNATRNETNEPQSDCVPASQQIARAPLIPDSQLAMEGVGLIGTWDSGFEEQLDGFWPDFDFNPSLLFPSSFATNYPMNFLPHPQLDPEHNHDETLSRFASRLPSVVPHAEEDRDPETRPGHQDDRIPRTANDASRKPTKPWCLSRDDYRRIASSLRRHQSLLPPDFEIPTRHALCRWIEGYFSGFHEHLPFIHLPTINPVTEPPELILAIIAVGARYRFQRQQSHSLYKAARSLVDYQIQQQDAYFTPPSVSNNPGILTDGSAVGSTKNTNFSPASAGPVLNSQALDPAGEQGTRNVKTMQAMILLIALGTWNHQHLLKDSFSMASQLAHMIRGEGNIEDAANADCGWEHWVRAEEAIRTKTVAFCFMNLHSITYNITPKLMLRDVGAMSLPAPESLWRAKNENAWRAARSTDSYVTTSIQNGFGKLFDEERETSPQLSISSFGSYVLIHCIIQTIFFNRQASLDFFQTGDISISVNDLAKFEYGLKIWQKNWETTKDSSLDPLAPGGPLSFNSTALFRVAYIRLYADLGHCRQLESRDPERIAIAFNSAPLLKRSSGVNLAALQSAHSLSIPVRIGIEFVARTQTLTWSIVHSLGNLECAWFLSKWLQTVAEAARDEPVGKEEKRILSIVTCILNDTDFGPIIRSEVNEVKRVKLMAMAVLRLWALTFKGAHVFDIMGTIGNGLNLCADKLQLGLEY